MKVCFRSARQIFATLALGVLVEPRPRGSTAALELQHHAVDRGVRRMIGELLARGRSSGSSLLTDTTSQGEAWHFSRVGRFIERADKTSRIVDVQYYILLPDTRDVGTALDVVRWSALLKSASALEMYRRQHGKIVPESVADFLILDRHFPRSMHFCLMQAQDSLRHITGSDIRTFHNAAEQRMGLLCSSMDYTSIGAIISKGLHEYIDHFQTQLNLVGEAIRDDFFIFHRDSRPPLHNELVQTQTL